MPLALLSDGAVLIAITLLVAPVAALAFARSGAAWDSIGKGAFSIEERRPEASDDPAERERALHEEVRQVVLAANERRRRRGEAPLDVAAETRRRLADSVGSSR